MAATNQKWVGKAIDLFKEGLVPFVERELRVGLLRSSLGDVEPLGLPAGLHQRRCLPRSRLRDTAVCWPAR